MPNCLGLIEIFDGTYRNHIIFDDGKVYYFNESLAPVRIETSDSITFARDVNDLYSSIQVGAYVAFTDRGTNTPYKWMNGDALLTKLIASGTEYKFRYLESFQRRVIGAYTNDTDGDISIRWSTSWPSTSIANLNFPAANQLYVPNDDSISGIKTMRTDQCFIYSKNSIHQLIYTPDYETPFRFYTVVPKQGCESHHSIVNLGDRHYLFNRNYGFCEYRGGNQFPFGGRPISEDIETDIQSFHASYYDRIVGAFSPLTREVVWTVPLDSESTSDHMIFYNIDTQQWRFEDRAMRYVDNWLISLSYTWTDLDTNLGGSAVWTDAGIHSWDYYPSERNRLVYMSTTGKLYYYGGDDLDGSDLDAYRIEPILDFGNPARYDLLSEIWYDLALTGSFTLHTWHRSGNTVGEVEAASWTALDDLSHDSPEKPCVHVNKSARLHQIKWGTDKKDEKFQVSRITFKYQEQGEF